MDLKAKRLSKEQLKRQRREQRRRNKAAKQGAGRYSTGASVPLQTLLAGNAAEAADAGAAGASDGEIVGHRDRVLQEQR